MSERVLCGEAGRVVVVVGGRGQGRIVGERIVWEKVVAVGVGVVVAGL